MYTHRLEGSRAHAGLQPFNEQDNGDSQQGPPHDAEIDPTLHKDDDCL